MKKAFELAMGMAGALMVIAGMVGAFVVLYGLATH